MRSLRNRVRRARRILWAFVALACVVAPAAAQTRDVDPHHVVVTGDRVYLRSGPGNVWYAVGHADTGDLLRVDGENYRWLRVSYPAGVTALVGADDADYQPARGVVVITRPTKLKARNIHGDTLGESWKNLLTASLKPGTELAAAGVLRDDEGKAEGYLVEAPASARAFISAQFTRRATPAEVAAWRASRRARAQLASGKTIPTSATQRPKAQTPAATVVGAGASAAHAPIPVAREKSNLPATNLAPPTLQKITDADSKTPTGHTQRARTPSVAIVTEPPAVSAPIELHPAQTRASRADQTPEPRTTISARTPNRIAAAPTPAARAPGSAATPPGAPPVKRPVPAFADLESAFKALAEEPIQSAEIDPLIAEYRRYLDSLPDTEKSRLYRMQVDSRIALLRVRRQLQKNLRELDAASADASRDADAIAARVSKLDRTRPYSLVGRLTTSALYDGKRLPLMYRLQSVEEGAGRTIAYLVPNAGVDLAGKLGSIVGVEGTSRLDPALKLRIVQPTRVQTLTPALSSVQESAPDQP